MALAATVRGEEISALYRQAGAVLWANVAASAIVTTTLWSSPQRTSIVAWFSAVLLLTALRYGLQRAYRRAPPPLDLERWGRRFVWSSTGSGLLWGVAGLAFFDSGKGASQALLTFAVGGM